MVPRRDGKRLERREETTGAGAGAAQMAAAAHRGGDGRPPGDGERLPQGSWDRSAAAGVVGATSAKSGQRDVHRPGSKTGQRGVHRLDGTVRGRSAERAARDFARLLACGAGRRVARTTLIRPLPRIGYSYDPSARVERSRSTC